MQRIRERVRARKTAIDPSPSGRPAPLVHGEDNRLPPLYDTTELRRNLDANNALWNVVGSVSPRPPGLRNQVIQIIKKTIRRLLTWYTQPLHDFHGSVTRSLNEAGRLIVNLQDNFLSLAEQVQALQSQTQALQSQTQDLQSQTQDLVLRVQQQDLALQKKMDEERASERLARQEESVAGQMAQLRAETEAVAACIRHFEENRLFERLRISERNVRRLMTLWEAKGQPLPSGRQRQLAAKQPPDTKDEFEFDYFWFQERFRGSEADIRERQRMYVEYFRGRSNVLDLGCGRGEFLELMREEKVSARGVETLRDMVMLCREKGLEIIEEDLLRHLDSVVDGSLGGLFSAQVIEHLTFEQQLQLLALARRKLAPESPLVIETINPECVFALVKYFHLDPTHVRPVHPELLRFLLQSMGFEDVGVRFSAPLEPGWRLPHLILPEPIPELQRFNEGIDRLNSFLFGYQDYAVVARR